MGNGYQIDLGEMKSLVSTLENAEESMKGADNALKDASPFDLGSAHLDSAGKAFQDAWEYGIGKIADLSGKMTEGLQGTLKTYQEAEDNISKLFPNGSDSGGGSTGHGGTPPGDAIGSAISNKLAGQQS